MTATNRECVIVTVLGENQPGILAEITRVVASANGNIEDVTQRILHGLFALMMVVDVSRANCRFDEFQARLVQAGEALKAKVIVQHENVFQFMHRL